MSGFRGADTGFETDPTRPAIICEPDVGSFFFSIRRDYSSNYHVLSIHVFTVVVTESMDFSFLFSSFHNNAFGIYSRNRTYG